MDVALRFAALVPLVAATLLAERTARLSPVPRHRLRSFAGGVATAYVFLSVLPKLASQQTLLLEASSGWPFVDYIYHHAYLMALVGSTTFYFSNVMSHDNAGIAVPRDSRGVVVVLGFAIYSGAFGDTIAAQDPEVMPLTLYSLALTLHLLGLHASLHEHLRASWSWLRWVLTVALVVGWAVAIVSPIPPPVHALVSAFIGGGIVILVVMIEVPPERRPVMFIAGVFTYAALLKLSLLLTGTEGGI